MEFYDKKVAFLSIVGSHNYNLNTNTSDKDYKAFIIPTFDDLYNNKMFSKNIISEKTDLKVHDIRKLPDLLFKANVNYLEVLFSEELTINQDIKEWKLLDELIALKNKIAKMNLPYLYKACKGMYYNRIKRLNNGTQETIHLVEKYGYDTKQAYNAYRILDFAERFYQTDFKNFKKAIYYNEKEKIKLLNIRNGKYSKEEINEMIMKKFDNFNKLEEIYTKQSIDRELYDKLKELIKKLVCINLNYKF